MLQSEYLHRTISNSIIEKAIVYDLLGERKGPFEISVKKFHSLKLFWDNQTQVNNSLKNSPCYGGFERWSCELNAFGSFRIPQMKKIDLFLFKNRRMINGLWTFFTITFPFLAKSNLPGGVNSTAATAMIPYSLLSQCIQSKLRQFEAFIVIVRLNQVLSTHPQHKINHFINSISRMILRIYKCTICSELSCNTSWNHYHNLQDTVIPQWSRKIIKGIEFWARKVNNQIRNPKQFIINLLKVFSFFVLGAEKDHKKCNKKMLQKSKE